MHPYIFICTEPQFNRHTLHGDICFLGDPWQQTVTSAGKEIYWPDIGIKINIPPGAIPEGKPIKYKAMAECSRVKYRVK